MLWIFVNPFTLTSTHVCTYLIRHSESFGVGSVLVFHIERRWASVVWKMIEKINGSVIVLDCLLYGTTHFIDQRMITEESFIGVAVISVINGYFYGCAIL